MELVAQASTAAEAAAAQAAAAAAALALGQTEPSPGLPDLAQAPLNTVSERGIPCRVGTGLSFIYSKLGLAPLVLLADVPVSGLYFRYTYRGTSLLLSMLLLSHRIRLSTMRDGQYVGLLRERPCGVNVGCLGMQGPSKLPEDYRANTSEQSLPSLPQACADALKAELRVWRLHSEISELALLTDRIFSVPEVRIILSAS